MEPQQSENPTPEPTKGYGKRSAWQWVVIYLVLAVIVYGLIYYFFMRDTNGADSTLY